MTARSAILVQCANGTLHTAELGFFPLQSRAHRLHEVIGTQHNNLGCNEHQYAEIHLHGDKLKKVKTFTHLGLTLAEDGELDAEVTHRVKSLWNNWNTMCGVLGDREHDDECEDQGEGVQGSGKTDTGVWGRDIGIGEGTGK